MYKRQTKKRNKRIARAAAILGALGGASRSPAKVLASRANGKKGGRPKRIKEASNEDLPSASAVTALYKRLEALTGPGVVEYSEADDEFVLVDQKRPRKEASNE